ncbi:MAG TPA: glyoxalase [Rheinheimera sp.]|uniref:VOC family protein n=1 Tax=unclassified Rheinheimera TaxID=115860 RepID=UPI000EE9F2F2|nr:MULTISPECIES: VOC family protein [unclassified Rheinheimera]MCT6698304.1 VOC family protein [Rheinheimera sp. 4Y26]HCU64266.1 glyoxalase [Rheinheimera sp.]
MQKVTGIGGVFLKARDPMALALWYQQHLGVPLLPGSPYGSFIAQSQDETVWSTFADSSDYFGRPEQQMMLNYRVTDLNAMLAQLKAAGVRVDEQRESGDYGDFGWAYDPEGNKFELWQPK